MMNRDIESKKQGINRVELFRVSAAEPLQISKNGGGLVANWDSVKWKDCVKIGLAIAGPAASTLGIDLERILYEEIQEIGDGVCRTSVAFVADILHTQLEADKQKLDEVVLGFIGYIFKENGRNLDLFEDNLNQNDFEAVVREHATNFLQENGGCKVSMPVQITGVSFNKICSGSFSRKPAVSPGKKVEKVFAGKVISMMCDKAEFVVKPALKDPTTIAYNKNVFFREVKELLGEPITGTFTTHEAMDPQGRIFLVLDSIDERHLDSGTLI